jgi:hypothetical protein
MMCPPLPTLCAIFVGSLVVASCGDLQRDNDTPSTEALATLTTVCTDCVQIRVGRPLIARGPYADELDNAFNEIQLSNGQHRGFSANATSYVMNGADPWSMAGARTAVMSPGSPGSYAECGSWLNDTEKQGSVVHGFVHAERSCNYAIGQTHKSMAFATSLDEGLTWTPSVQILTGTDAPAAGRITGEGDCTVVKALDAFYYAYCLRARDWSTIVARAPVGSPGPGNWKKYLAGQWTSPGLGGDATAVGGFGIAAARWTDNDNVVLLGIDPSWGGLKVSFSSDKTSFRTMLDPVIHLDDANWARPAPSELIAYTSMMNYSDANNQISSPFLLAYVYIQPNEDFAHRYLVFRDVWISVAPSPVTPQASVALSRWYNASLKDRWSTTAPVPGNFTAYAFEGTFGYLMTRAHATLPTVKLEDCVSNWPGHPDHLLTNDGQCASAGYTRLRTAGWLYRDSQPNTVPVYRCYNPAEQHHFASNQSNCDQHGTVEWLLGWALAS